MVRLSKRGKAKACCAALTADGRPCKGRQAKGLDVCAVHTAFERFDCPVCYCGVGCRGDACILKCGHRFCNVCIKGWFEAGKDSCPMCRARVGMGVIMRYVPAFADRFYRSAIPLEWYEVPAGHAEEQVERMLHMVDALHGHISRLQGRPQPENVVWDVVAPPEI